MKKLYYLIILTVILGLVLTGCTLLSNIGQTPTSEQSGITYLIKALSSDFVGLWHFDEGSGVIANDSSGNGNTGTLELGMLGNTDPASAWVDDQWGGQALSFDGLDDYVLVTHDGSLMFNSGDFSVELWAKPADMSGYTGLITTDIAGDKAWKIYRDSGQSYFRARYGSTKVEYPTVSAGDWHYYGYVKSGTTLSIYFDGEFVTSATCPATHTVAGTELVLGSYRIQNAKDGLYIYNGAIDEVRIWDEALTAEQIKASYDGGLRKELDQTTANLGDHVGVTLDVIVAFDPSVTVTVFDMLPPELRCITDTFEVDGNPAIPMVDGQTISYPLGLGAHTITFDAQVTSAEAEAATPNTVTNEATADGASASAELTINPYDGFTKEAELLSTEDGDMIIEVGEEIEWKVTITVTNIPDEIASMNNIVVQDRFGGELEIDSHLVSGSGSLEVKTFGKTKKPKIKWDGFSLLVDGASEKADLFVSTDTNPGGHQSYSTASTEGEDYEMNSGAVLKFIDSEGTGFQLSAHTPQITVEVFEP